jgi:predicted metal-dependent hydrolase
MSDNLEEIKKFYGEAFQFYAPKRAAPEIAVEFYPYIGINHTIRVRSGAVFVRIAEICREMPASAQKALAYILVAKLFRRKVSPQAREIYANFVKRREIRETAAQNKKTKGRKIIGSPRGDVYNLEEIFDRLNRTYFRNSLPKPILGWSARKTYRILGHHDATHETVVVSRSLDDKKVPKYVVEFVVFHEMLHIFHPTEHRGGRRYNHTPRFRRDERKFAYFEEAENWIERSAKHLKRKAREK